MKIYISMLFVGYVSSLCTFSSDTCQWNFGRRWHRINSNSVLMADAEGDEDKRMGFTDAIMSSWLSSSSLCSYQIRLTLKYSIENLNDLLEIYIIERNQSNIHLLTHWKMQEENQTNSLNNPIWQQGNITFQTKEQFRIDIQIRHLADSNSQFRNWFLLNDISIENCSLTIHQISDEQPSRNNLILFILYFLCSFLALIVLMILFSIILFTYRKYLLKTHSYQTSKNRIGIQNEQN